MQLKSRAISGIGLVLALLAGVFLLRPDAESAAAAMVTRISERTGLSARIEGPARYAFAWPLRLEIPAVEIDGLGRVGKVVLVDGAFDAQARFFGRTGVLALRAGAFRFSAEGLQASLAAADGRLVVETKFAGSELRIAGLPAAGGIDALEIGWSGHVLKGTARPSADRSALDVTAAGDGIELSGRALPADGVFEGTLASPAAGLVRAEFRAGDDVLDVAAFELAAPDFSASGSLRRDAQRLSIDARIGEIGITSLADLARNHLGDAAGDIDLRLRIGRLAWEAGEAQGIILVAAREAGRLVIDELAVRALAEANLRVRAGLLDLQVPDASRFLAALGAPVERHLGALTLRGPLAFEPDGPALRLAPLEIALAGQSARGEAVWRDGRLSLSLTGDRVSLDPFFARPLAAPPVRGPLLTRSQAARAAAAALPPAPGPGGWSRVPIRPDLLGGMPLDLRLAARELALGGLILGDARFAAAYDARGFDVSELSGSLFGGAFRASGRVDAANPRVAFGFALAGAEWARVLAATGAAPVLRGPVTFQGSLATSGANVSAMMAALAGSLRVESPGGTLEGVDLAGLLAYAAASRTPDLAELGRRFARGGRGTFGALAGTWRIEGGRASTADTRFAARGGVLELSGLFDLANWNVDLAAMLVADSAQIVPRLTMAGPPDRAKITLSAAPVRAAGPPAGSGAGPRAPAVRR